MQLPPPSVTTTHLPPGWTQAPRGYGGSDRGSPPYPVQDCCPPQSSSQSNPGPVGPTPMIEPNCYPPQPQNPAARDYIPYSFASTANQPPLAHPSSNQQPGAPGHPSEYQQYLANFGLNAISHPAVMFPNPRGTFFEGMSHGLWDVPRDGLGRPTGWFGMSLGAQKIAYFAPQHCFNVQLPAGSGCGGRVCMPTGPDVKKMLAAAAADVKKMLAAAAAGTYARLLDHRLEPCKQRGHPTTEGHPTLSAWDVPAPVGPPTLSAWDVPTPVGPPISLCGMSHIIFRGTSLLRHMLVGRPSLPAIT
ncbi:hypothetical protein FB451DRAFT_1187755 [Mycena latifolia]|nr:hypothetical protein FB451DRAFT_1187755 [Mycena latifolia]